MQAQRSRPLQVRGAGSKSGTMEKAKIEAQAARSLAETSYQDQRFSLPPGFLSGPAGAEGGAPCLGPAVVPYNLLLVAATDHNIPLLPACTASWSLQSCRTSMQAFHSPAISSAHEPHAGRCRARSIYAGRTLPVSGTKRRKVEAKAEASKAQSDTILWMVNIEECNKKLRCACSLSPALPAMQYASWVTGCLRLPLPLLLAPARYKAGTEYTSTIETYKRCSC